MLIEKEKTMLAHQFNALSLKEQAAHIKELRSMYAENRATKKAFLEKAKAFKAQAKAEKQAAAIVKAQARLQKLLDKQAAPVGVKAIKANRKPSKAIVTKAA
jgi:hypothetical protein